MTAQISIALAQINLKAGAIADNLRRHIEVANYARDTLKADAVVFPELSITGYPPEDLLLRPSFLAETDQALATLKQEIKGIYCFIGHPLRRQKDLYNACTVIHDGETIAEYFKHHLPDYGPFDECRYFTSGNDSCLVTINNIKVGLIICEDAWYDAPIKNAVLKGAQLIVVPNASPFETDKHERRIAMLQNRVNENHVPILYINCVGGQDEMTFDGGSMAINEVAELAHFSGFFQKAIDLVQLDFTQKSHSMPAIDRPNVDMLKRIYDCLVLSIQDYINKNRLPGVLVGLSGGIDSALTTVIAVDALGKDKVEAVLMPSRHTADISNEDALALVQQLNISHHTISIEETYRAFLTSLKPSFAELAYDVTEQNIQARIRAVLLMALSNKFGKLVLTTGNRSELAVGYCTLYGDMAGGFAVLKDIPKTLVYALARYRNKISPVIPDRIIARQPTAELADNQLDQDTLPPYDVLDEILYLYLNLELGRDEIIAAGFSADLVDDIIKRVNGNEYKRRQAAVGPRINAKAFGRDRRYPITNGFKG